MRRIQTAIPVSNFIGYLVAAMLTLLVPTMANAAACTVNCLAPGNYSLSMAWGGLSRQYLLHIPASYTGNVPVPLVIDAHGSGETDTDQMGRSGQLAQSDIRGFIVAWPQGILNSWNAYGCCGVPYYTEVDDVGFIRALISSLESQTNVDPRRVFMTGWSNGAGLTQRMACEAADVIVAAAAVSYPVNTTTCNPSRPITVVEFAGTADALVNYYGLNPLFESAAAGFATWQQSDGCNSDLTTTPLNAGSQDQEYLQCAQGVHVGLVTVASGMHDLYPSSSAVDNLANGYGPSGVNIAEYIWDNIFTQD